MRRRLLRERALVVLNLHRVSPRPSPYWPPLHPRLFEDLLAFLARWCQVVTFGELAHGDDLRPDRVPVILSFDDGYKDFVEYAMPVLDRFRMRANQNVVPGCIETNRPPWSVQVTDFLGAAPPKVLEQIRLPGLPRASAGAPGFGAALVGYLKSLPHRELNEQLESLGPLISQTDVKPTPMMSLSEVREAAAVHELGVHSFSHQSMGVEDNEFFRDDFDRCRRFCADQLSLPLEIYAFPNGSYRDDQAVLLRSWGVRHVLLVDERASRPDRWAHPRFTFYGSSGSELRLRALGWTRSGSSRGSP